MTQSTLYALDFDGVICDSALETGMAGWKAALQIWDDMPSQQAYPFREAFRQTRPILETGYEAILIIRLLFLGETPATILAHFAELKQAVIDSAKWAVKDLQKLFSETRDTWIHEAPDEWALLNPLFPGVADKLTALSQQGIWTILTTKQERFVLQILKAHQITLPEQHIFGLDRQLAKEEVLVSLVGHHPDTTLIFVEDRLPALLTVKDNPKLHNVTLQLADWGYNTLQDRHDAEQAGIAVISLEQLIPL
jgi:phosphoglycolate phosphatase-like HAD superfamily hydrolase